MQLSVGAIRHFEKPGLSLNDALSCGVDFRPLATTEEETSSIVAESELAWLYPQAGPCLITSLDDHVIMPFSKTQQMHTVFDHSTLQASSDLEDSSGHHVAVTHSTKKKRLSDGQVKFLERNFNLDSKLEPERKNQLAHELGLQPRQVAIWYQNKRARSKTKQLEQKYDALKGGYEDVLVEKMRLETEITRLREMLNNEFNPPGAKTTAPVEKGGAAEASRNNDEDQPWSKDGGAVAFEEWHRVSYKGAVAAAKFQDGDGKLETVEDDIPAETDVESIELSSGTEQSEALDASSPASSDNQQKRRISTEPSPHDFTVDHRLLCNQQHQLLHSLMYPEQGTVKIENGESLFLNTPILPELDHYYSAYLFSLEDVNHLPLI